FAHPQLADRRLGRRDAGGLASRVGADTNIRRGFLQGHLPGRVSVGLCRRRAPRPAYSSIYKWPLPTVRTDRAVDAFIFYFRLPGDTLGTRGPRARTGLVERPDHDRPAGFCRGRGLLVDSDLRSLGRRRRRRTHDGVDSRVDVRRLAPL